MLGVGGGGFAYKVLEEKLGCDLMYVLFVVLVCTVTEYGDNSPW